MTISASQMPERKGSHWISRGGGILFAAKTIPRLRSEAITLPLLGALMAIMERNLKNYACDGRLDTMQATGNICLSKEADPISN